MLYSMLIGTNFFFLETSVVLLHSTLYFEVLAHFVLRFSIVCTFHLNSSYNCSIYLIRLYFDSVLCTLVLV
jgi:hypothetical protein